MGADNIKILLVEDDENLGQILKEYLGIKGYNISLAKNGQIGLNMFHKEEYDFCILDIMMPVMDGYELAEQIRKINTDVPLLFLSAKSMKEDRITGLELGADDYLTKPFSMEELLLRIKAILKRAGKKSQAQKVFNIGLFTFDYNQQKISVFDDEQKLTTKENELLYLLCKNKNEVLTREEALLKIWGDDSYYTARSMDVFISKLRKRLNADDKIKIINVHGSGFKLIS
jgi:DNA-binding response OmpR family regulator